MGEHKSPYLLTYLLSLLVCLSVNVTSLAAGPQHVLAVSSDGQVFSWGQGSYGRLGLGNDDNQWVPEQNITLSLDSVHSTVPCLKKTKKNHFCHNFVKFPPTLIILAQIWQIWSAVFNSLVAPLQALALPRNCGHCRVLNMALSAH